MTKRQSVLAKSGKFEPNQVRSSDPNRERGTSDLSSRRRWAALPDKFAVGAHLARPYFFSFVTEPYSSLLSLRDQRKIGPSFIFLLQFVTDAGTRSGHCDGLIPARRNPLSWLVNLHQIGTSVLPTNLIHPTAYTVVVYQAQGSSCASCQYTLPVHLSLSLSLCPCPKLLCRRQSRGLVVIAPRVFQQGCIGCPPFILIFVVQISPFIQKASASRCILSISYDSLVDQMLSPARGCQFSGSISWFKRCAHGALSPHVRCWGTWIPQIVSKSRCPAGHRKHVRLP